MVLLTIGIITDMAIGSKRRPRKQTSVIQTPTCTGSITTNREKME